MPVITLTPQRRIFSNPPKRLTGLAIFAVIIAAASAVIVYLRQEPQGQAPITRTTPTPPTPATQQGAVSYQAVIEKTEDGVVITLQGPDHEEVLTRLPPGYSPVVEGNKVVHIVTPGNTLWFIAKRYVKNPYRYPELARLNKIPNPDLIYPGDKVIIQYLRKP